MASFQKNSVIETDESLHYPLISINYDGLGECGVKHVNRFLMNDIFLVELNTKVWNEDVRINYVFEDMLGSQITYTIVDKDLDGISPPKLLEGCQKQLEKYLGKIYPEMFI